jgi:hypothetical protein
MARHIDNSGRREYTLNFNGVELSPCTVEEVVDGSKTTTFMRYFKQNPCLVRRITETEVNGVTTTEDEKAWGNWDSRAVLTNFIPINDDLVET